MIRSGRGEPSSIILLYLLNTTSVIDAVYKLASYTYGPILGMFAFYAREYDGACTDALQSDLGYGQV